MKPVHTCVMLDDRDKKILTLLQANAEASVAEIADQVSLSPSACSRRIVRLRADGYIKATVAVLDREKINLPTTVFLLVRTGHHNENWLEKFHAAVNDIPEITEVHRLTGNFDYIMKLVLPDVEYYDTVYKNIVRKIEMFDMSAYISMETVKQSRGLPTHHI